MGARSSSCFNTATAAELSPEFWERASADATSTSGRTEYYSARSEAMKRSQPEFSDTTALDIAYSKPHISEVIRPNVAPLSRADLKLIRANQKEFDRLKLQYFHFCVNCPRSKVPVVGRMLAKGGQAEIYEVADHTDYVVKIFHRGTSLKQLRRTMPFPLLETDHPCVRNCLIMGDGRFAFWMAKAWGDLRKLIDQAMQTKNQDNIQGPPFPYKWDAHPGWTFHNLDFMWAIATHMKKLHEQGVVHRDLKGSNVLLNSPEPRRTSIPEVEEALLRSVVVADFECTSGVLGTGFWRAPEVLVKRKRIAREAWKKADVYSFGMTCFEIVTGRIPFDGELADSKEARQVVVEGKRPVLPRDLEGGVKDLIGKCWHGNPSMRPTFGEVVEIVEALMTKECKFRLFHINEELPLPYILASVQDADEHSLALMKAMPKLEIVVNLTNGSLQGDRRGYNISMERRNDVDHKLARLQ